MRLRNLFTRRLSLFLCALCIPAAGQQERSIAVMPFSDVAGEIQLPAPTGMALSEILSMKLEEGGFLTLPRERMGELLDAIGAPSSPFLDKDLLRSAGTRLGISTVVRGNYYFDDTAWRLSVRLIDTESGLIYSTFESNAPTEGLVAAVDEIALRICSSLNVSVSETAQERMGRHGSTVPEALREFGKGVNYHKGILSTPVLERSARHYARAIEADSSFELARYYYALVYNILGLEETVSRSMEDVSGARVGRTISIVGISFSAAVSGGASSISGISTASVSETVSGGGSPRIL
jgi:hypothetical protein